MPKEKAKKSREDYDRNKFVNGFAAVRYSKHIVQKNLIPERGFHNPGGRVEGVIETRNWHHFTMNPSAAVAPMVREFYANLPEHMNDAVYVRGIWVKFDHSTINSLYELEDVDSDNDQYITYCKREIDYDLILRYLCGGNTQVDWKRRDNKVINFPASGLNSNSKAWHYFISGRLLPSGNTSEVTRDRAVLNYCIQINLSINLGKIINRSIMSSLSASSSTALGHPSLIHELCISQGVNFLPGEEVHHPKSAITKQKISAYSTRSLFERGESSGQTPKSSSKGKDISLAEQIGELSNSVNLLNVTMKEHNDWHEEMDNKATHYMEQHHQHFEYVSDFNQALSQMFTNYGLNVGTNRVEFPEPPIYSYYKSPNEDEEEEEEE